MFWPQNKFSHFKSIIELRSYNWNVKQFCFVKCISPLKKKLWFDFFILYSWIIKKQALAKSDGASFFWNLGRNCKLFLEENN